MLDNELFGLIAFMAAIAIPVIVIFLARHQQRMAEILQNSQRSARTQEDALMQEILAMRNILAQQTILLDNLVQKQEDMDRKLSDADVRQRLGA